MKNQAHFTIFLFLGFASLVYVLSLSFVDAVKIESDVTISASSIAETENICDNRKDNDNSGKIDADEQDCVAEATGTCEMEIISGAPIDYGQLNVGQVSNEQKVTIKNVGTATAQIIVKASDWIGGTSANPIKMSGPEVTRVAVTPGKDFGTKFALHSSEATVLSDLGPGQERDSFWSLYADPKLSGSPHQEVSIDLICPDIPTDLKNALTKGQGEITRGEEFLQDAETKVDNNDDTSASTPNAPDPIPIPYPNTNNTTKAQITTD